MSFHAAGAAVRSRRPATAVKISSTRLGPIINCVMTSIPWRKYGLTNGSRNFSAGFISRRRKRFFHPGVIELARTRNIGESGA
jgi:hypothetical protein